MKTFKPIEPIKEPRFNLSRVEAFCYDLLAGFGLGAALLCIYLIIEPFTR
ncbi:MAG: hypothetical protein WCS28_12135 [Thiomicrospira sp.]|jgi:hypothetical protein